MESEKGTISQSMGVDTKPAHRFMIGEHWVLVDPKMPEELFIKLKEKIQNGTKTN
jgi:hypothetical protein